MSRLLDGCLFGRYNKIEQKFFLPFIVEWFMRFFWGIGTIICMKRRGKSIIHICKFILCTCGFPHNKRWDECVSELCFPFFYFSHIINMKFCVIGLYVISMSMSWPQSNAFGTWFFPLNSTCNLHIVLVKVLWNIASSTN